MTPTERRLAEILERAEKATAGPWSFDYDGDVYYEVKAGEERLFGGANSDHDKGFIGTTSYWTNGNPNAVFIAHARQDIPDLAKALRVAVEALEGLVEYESCGMTLKVDENSDASVALKEIETIIAGEITRK